MSVSRIPPPVTDAARLAALASYAILDTPAEPGFDDIVHLACQICATPVSLVSLVARDRQWFKASVGFPHCETDLNSSVCAHALAEPDHVLVIPDLTADERTRANPLVTGEPSIRFYAGAPLVTAEGHVLGSLCVIDTVPRPAGLPPEQVDALRALARQVVTQLELRASLLAREAAADKERRLGDALRRSEARNRLLLEGIDVGFCVVDVRFEDGVDGPRPVDYRFLEVNPAFERQTGLVHAVGRWMRELAPDHEQHWFDLYGRVALTGEPARFENGAAALGRWYDVHALRVGEPHERRVAILFNDISSRRAAEVALRASETYWRSLFDRLGEGFFTGEVVRDERGVIADWRYLQVNPAWSTLVGVEAAAVVGRTVREAFPGIEDEWVTEFAGVVDTGEPVTFTRQVGLLHRWYEGRAFRLDDERFGVLFLEVTGRIEAEQRRAALLQIGDKLRDLTTVPEMTRAASEIVGRTLGATRAGFGRLDADMEFIEIEPDWTVPAMTSIAGRHRFEDYGDIRHELVRGEPLIIEDVTTDPRTRHDPGPMRAVAIAALVNMPVRERGRTVAVFIVHDDKPRAWSPEALAFLRNVADRVEAGVARLRAEELQAVLNRELAHRLKNTLAIVQSIANQALRDVTERDLVEAFERRVLALSRAHDVLMQKSWSAARMRAVMESVLTLQTDLDRFAFDGPDIDITPEAALSLSLLLHELATNALKYGALSASGGRIAVRWHAEDGGSPTLVLGWTEEGGPPVKAPSSRKGFGSKLIRMGLLGTKVADLRYERNGLRAEFRAPLAEFRSR